MIRILLVDDDARIRSIVREYAQAEDWTFDEAADGEEALRLFSAGSYALVVLDVMMPRLDGWGALKQIRKSSQTPVILDNTVVGAHALVRNAIVDKNVVIPPGAQIGVDSEHDRARGFVISEGGVTVVGKGQRVTA